MKSPRHYLLRELLERFPASRDVLLWSGLEVHARHLEHTLAEVCAEEGLDVHQINESLARTLGVRFDDEGVILSTEVVVDSPEDDEAVFATEPVS